jgi:hypothetical protein
MPENAKSRFRFHRREVSSYRKRLLSSLASGWRTASSEFLQITFGQLSAAEKANDWEHLEAPMGMVEIWRALNIMTCSERVGSFSLMQEAMVASSFSKT